MFERRVPTGLSHTPRRHCQNTIILRNRLSRATPLLAVLVLSLLNPGRSNALAQSTAFTYQGRLETNSVPVTGRLVFQATLWDAASGGSLVAGNSPTTANLDVTNGLFVLPLDFGALPFSSGADRWLQIEVANPGDPFTALTPRQRVDSTPYAYRAATAGAADAVSAANVTGTLSLAQLPPPVLTNNQPEVNLTGSFSGSFTGNGAGLTDLNAWQLGGNAGTAPGVNFLGTTDNQPLEFRVNQQRTLRLEPNTGGAPNVIAGAAVNFVGPGVHGATISGGGATNVFGQAFTNRVAANLATVSGGADNAADEIFSTVGGGRANRANGISALVAGGWYNTASGGAATVGGGENNLASGSAATVAGGNNNLASGGNSSVSGSHNTASGDAATVGGGFQNTAGGLSATVAGGSANQATNNYAAVGGGYANQAGGPHATVPGGLFNRAAGATAFAAGRRAKALHDGAFNWADAQDADFYSTSSNQFNVRAAGGARFVTGGAGLTVDGQPVLAGVNGGTLTNLNASQLAGGTVPEAALNNAWKIGGNSGTSPAANFLGTIDNQPMELKVNGNRALRVEPATSPNLIGGHSGNSISNDVVGGLIAGGGSAGQPNRVGANFASVLGGANNAASGIYSTAMGSSTTASGEYSTAMGIVTTASGNFSTAMGFGTIASGDISTALGFYARAAHPGSFVWADSSAATPFSTTANNQFLIRALGGVGINTTNPAGAALAVNGAVTASSFSGSGAGLTGINAATLGGVSAAQFIRNDITNSQNVTFAANTQVQLGGGGASVPSLTFASDLDTGLFPAFGGGLGFTVDGLERMRANATGVGIGTGNPQGPLHIYSANNPAVVRVQSSAQPGFSRLEFVSNPQGDANEWRPGYIQSTDAGSFTGGLAFYVNGTGAGSRFGSNEVMRLQNGRVGIGTTSPQSQLHVQGTVRVTGADQWDVNNTEGDFRVGSDTHRFKIGVSQGGGGAGDVWMRAQGGTARLFLKTPGGTTIYSNEAQTNGVSLAAGGGSWTSVSDRNAKENFEPVNAQDVLDKVVALPLANWNYKSQNAGIRHLGPMAQDFKAAFGLGESDTGITTVDADGVALAAIQGLNQKVESGQSELVELRAENAALKARLEKLEQIISQQPNHHAP